MTPYEKSFLFVLRWAVGLSVFFLLVCVYWPGRSGPMVFDDFANIVQNEAVHISSLDWQSLSAAAFSTMTGPLARPIPMASFALNQYFFGLNEFSFKAVNVVLHFINGLLVYVLSVKVLRLLSNRTTNLTLSMAALFASTCWLLHPVQVTSVLYVVQRMVELSSLFGLLCVLFYIHGRQQARARAMVCWHVASAFCLLLALLCKENLIILVPLLACLEWLLFRFESPNKRYLRLIKLLMLTAGGVLLGYIVYKFPSFAAGYQFRPFTMEERLFTQARVMFVYLGQILVPDISRMHLFHDEIAVSRSLLAPITTIFSVIGIFVMAVATVLLRKKNVLAALAMSWFLIGHLVESTFISLEMVHIHRNYFPMIGLFIWLAAGMAALIAKRQAFAAVLAVLVVAVLGYGTHHRAMDWSSWEVLVVTEAEKNPHSARSQYEAGRYYYWLVEKDGKANYKEENYAKSVFYFERGAASSDSSLTSLAALIRLADLAGVSGKEEWRQTLLTRIGTRRPDPNDINKVGDLFQCRLKEQCTVDSGFLSQVAAATMANASLPAISRSAIASAASSLALIDGRGDFAVYYAMYALDQSPRVFDFMRNAMVLARILNDVALGENLMRDYAPRFTEHEQQQRLAQEYRLLLKGPVAGETSAP